MDAALIIIEGAKLMLNAYFAYLKQAGKTLEEIDALYQMERDIFKKNNPDNLEDV